MSLHVAPSGVAMQWAYANTIVHIDVESTVLISHWIT